MTDVERAWRIGYAIQAKSDLAVYQLLASQLNIPACHRLHYLQMCLEKTAKAYLWQSGKRSERSDKIGTSHKFIEKILPQLLREYYLGKKPKRPLARIKWKRLKQLCQELDYLAPATDDAGQRPDNCEYPWRIDDVQGNPRIFVPVLHAFPVLAMIEWPEARTLLRCVEHLLPRLAR